MTNTLTHARRRATATTFTLVLIGAVAFSGCNQGGDTTCAKFRRKTPFGQKRIVTKLLKEKGQEVTPLRVMEARFSAKGYCFTHTGDDKIDNIYGR